MPRFLPNIALTSSGAERGATLPPTGWQSMLPNAALGKIEKRKL